MCARAITYSECTEVGLRVYSYTYRCKLMCM